MKTFRIETTSTDRIIYIVKANSMQEARDRVEQDGDNLEPFSEIWGDPEITSAREVG